MSGGKGGGSSPTSSTVTQTNLPAYAEPYFKDIMSKAQAVSNSPYQQYSGARLTGFAPDTLNAYQGFRDQAAEGTPGTDAAYGMASGAVGGYNPWNYQADQVAPTGQMGYGDYGQLVQNFMNPYTQNVIDVQKGQAQQDFDRNRSSQNAQYVKAGAFGGSRSAVNDYLGQEGLLNRQAGIEATGLNSAYNLANQGALQSQQFNFGQGMQANLANQQANMQAQQYGDQSRQFGANLGLQGAGVLSNLDAQRFNIQNANNKNLTAIGQDYQNQAQRGLDLQYENWQNARDYPRQNLNWMSGILHGVPVTPEQSISNSQYQSPISSVLGAGISGVALGNLLNGQSSGGGGQ